MRHWYAAALIALAVWLCATQPAQAQQPFCRIANRHADGTLEYGSGTLIDCNDTLGLVLTCAHLFDRGVGQLEVQFAEGTGGASGTQYGTRYRGHHAVIDLRGNDVGVVFIDRPAVKPVPLGSFDGSGDYVCRGFGPDGTLATFNGRVWTYRQPQGASYASPVLTTQVRQGDSGGGVMNERGELVGVVWGCNQDGAHITAGRPVDEFLVRLIQCSDGNCWRPSPLFAPGGRPLLGGLLGGRLGGGGGSGGGLINGGRVAGRPPSGGARIVNDDPGQLPLYGNHQKPALPPAADAGRLPPLDSLIARLEQTERAVADLRAGKQDRGQYITRGELPGLLPPLPDAAGFVRRDELSAVSGRIDVVQGHIEQHETDLPTRLREAAAQAAEHAREAAATIVVEGLRDRVGLFEGLTAGRLVAGALGLSSPVALAAIVGVMLLRRAHRSRRHERHDPDDVRFPSAQHGGSSPLQVSPPPFPVAVDTPPPPQQTVHETHYVPYESDQFAAAHQWASEQVVRKWPGATATMTALDGLIKQYMNAKAERREE